MQSTPDAPPAPRHWRSRLAGSVAVTALAAATWAVAAPPGQAGSGLRLPGVEVTVQSVAPERMAHQAAMPAGMMPGTLPEGSRRVAVDVTLTGRGGGGSYDGRQLRLEAAGLPAPVAPERTDLTADHLPGGAAVTGTLVFAVPAATREATLTASGGNGGLLLHLPSADGAHGTGGH